jgi:broad specificity phosphatase PhoE
MHLVLVRHGDAHAGFDGVVSGPRGCRGLTDLGRRQAEALASYLRTSGRIHADVLLSSVLPRALETAEIIAPSLGPYSICQECDLCEIHTGEADGLEWAEYATRYGTFDMEAEPERVFAPGGESWLSFHERVIKMCDRLAADYSGRTVVAVCHAGVIMASIRGLFGIGTGTRIRTRLQPVNTGLTEWEHEASRELWTLRSFNEQTHLLGIAHRDSDSEELQAIRSEK